jgi:hypothetical protein
MNPLKKREPAEGAAHAPQDAVLNDPVHEEVEEEFREAQSRGTGSEALERRLKEHTEGPELSGGDIDAAWDEADVGDETAGGSAATPDQGIVEELGDALGIRYLPDEPLRIGEKEEERDRHRWEEDPASSEDYEDRIREREADG